MPQKQWTVEDSIWWRELDEEVRQRILRLVLSVSKPEISTMMAMTRLSKL